MSAMNLCRLIPLKLSRAASSRLARNVRMSALNSRHSESIGQTGELSGDLTGFVGADFALADEER
jgi:hypothetical protein